MPFLVAFKQTDKVEGGYSNRKNDKGGETFRGVSREHFPDELFWKIVDANKSNQEFPECLDDNESLDKCIMDFYRKEFWRRPNIEMIDHVSPIVAHKLYDLCVNFGKSRPSKWLQRTLNLLNRNEKAYADIKVDGAIGMRTKATLLHSLDHNPVDRILTVMKCIQGSEYVSIMEQYPEQEENIGWFDRIKF